MTKFLEPHWNRVRHELSDSPPRNFVPARDPLAGHTVWRLVVAAEFFGAPPSRSYFTLTHSGRAFCIRCGTTYVDARGAFGISFMASSESARELS